MSRQNKVNPGMYTQRGRLTQDDAAREIAKQRNIGSPNTWQPVQRDQQPPMFDEPGQDEAESDLAAQTPAAIEKEPARAKAVQPASARSAKPAKPAKPSSRRPAKTAARKKTAPRKSAPRKSGMANRATTATKRGKAKNARPAKAKATSARAGKAKAKSAKRRKT